MVMPLSEISNNARRSASTSRVKPRSDGGSDPGPSLPPTAVHSMLRTTTELGDLGQFATRPSRVPRSASRIQSTRPRSGSFDTSLASALRHQRSSQVRRPGRQHGPRPAASMSGLSARYTSRSNVSSNGHNSRQRRYPHSQYPHSIQGMATSGSDSYTHRSLLTLRGTRDVHSNRSTSPRMMHPGQRRRPGFRASSPAYSDMPSFSATPRPAFMRAPSAGTVTSSPASMYPRRPGMPGYRPDFNASCASLVRLPSPAVSFMRNGPHATPGPSMRTPAPMATSFKGPRSIMSSSAVSVASIPKSPTGSTAPAYYDYSESFVEEDCFSPNGGQDAMPPLTIDQTILQDLPTPPRRDAQTPFGTRQGSTFRPSELPTKHNRRPSEHSKHSKHSKQSKHSFNGVIPKRVSSLAGPALHKSSPDQYVGTRRTRSEDSGLTESARAERDARRASITSRRSGTPSSTSLFFPNASRSPRDLTTLAARFHSPPIEVQQRQALTAAMTPVKAVEALNPECAANFEGKHSPNWQLPALAFRPISFASYDPSPSDRPRTSEATPSRKPLEILSPMPERPMSSQSRKRFSKILEIGDTYDTFATRPCPGSLTRWKAPTLRKVEEAPDPRLSMMPNSIVLTPGPSLNELPSPPLFNQDGTVDADARISQVTSHDKSTIESLLDRHIECLGLQPESDADSYESTSLEKRRLDEQSSAEDTIRLTDILASVPSWPKGRPWTSSSQQPSSLGRSEMQKLRPRRLFASMDARVPETIGERSTPAFSTDSIANRSRLSFGWQTLPSTSQFASPPTASTSSVVSGELGDIDSSEQQAKLKIKRRSDISMSVSVTRRLSELSAGLSKEKRDKLPPRRSKSEIIARQASHKRRRMRIMMKLKLKSRTVGDLLDEDLHHDRKEQGNPEAQKPPFRRRSSITSPVPGYAELSGDSVLPSMETLDPALPTPPVIPTRWSSIIAAMPEPVKKRAEVVRKASKCSNKSHQSNASIVEPMNSTRMNCHIPRLGSIPKLAPPEFGPALSISDLNLSIPYADIPSTIRPTLRETKSFFSDDSSAHQQRRSLRQKFALHSLRNALPGSSGTSIVARDVQRAGTEAVKLSHSCQMKGKKSYDGHSSAAGDDLIPMSDFTYRKRKVLERIKGWWRRQCVPRRLASRRKGERTMPGGAGW